MNNLKIKFRLSLSFGFVLALMALIVIISITRLAAMDEGTDDIVNDEYPKVLAIYDVHNQLNQIIITAGNALVLDPEEAEEIASEVATIEKLGKNIDANLVMLEKAAVDDEDRKLIGDILKARDGYMPELAKFLTLVANKKTEDAKDFLLGNLPITRLRYVNAINAQKQHLTNSMKEAGEHARKTYTNAKVVVLVLAGFALALAAMLAAVVTRSITRPIDFALRIANQVAAGDLSSNIQVRGKDEVSQLLVALQNMDTNLSGIVAGVRRGAEHVANASDEIAQGNQDLSGRTEKQATALVTTAASMQELSVTVSQNADHARDASLLAKQASDVAAKGGDVVARAVQTMQGINESSHKIADIIGVIDGIAFQTNILALNAAVEAARAGEEGRGFAVVASEVRSLAGRSAKAAKEIKILINTSVERVEQGTALVDEAGVTITEVVDSIRRVADIVNEISSASAEQSEAVTIIGETLLQMEQSTQQNAALVEEMAASTDSLSSQAQDLVESMAVFTLGESGYAGDLPSDADTDASNSSDSVPRLTA